MPRTGFGNGDLIVAISRQGGHFLCPVFPIAILDAQSDGRTDGFAPTDSRTNLRLVLFDKHAPAAAVALLAAPKIVVNFVDSDGKPRRHPIDDHGQTGAVGFSRCKVAQHAGYPSVINYTRLGVG